MSRFGFTLFSELNGPRAMLEQARAAEDAGVDFLGMSDHFHPWLSQHTDSPFAWTALGSVAAVTERVDLVTLVTCPFLRYHPAIIAQAAATVQDVSEGRFTLGLGAGENLSEHIVGEKWPSVTVRHEMLRESIEIIRALWQGDWVRYEGRHLTVEDARLHTLPDTAPRIGVAASGPSSVKLAAEHGDDLITDAPEPDVLSAFRQRSPHGQSWTQIPVAYDQDHDTALAHAHHFAFSATGWKVMSELPNIPSFDEAAALVDDETIQQMVPTGSDPGPLVEQIEQAREAGFDNISFVQVAPERTERFHRWFDEQVRPRLA